MLRRGTLVVPGHLINTLRSVPSVTLTVESVTIVVASRGALRLHGVSGLLGNAGAADRPVSLGCDFMRLAGEPVLQSPGCDFRG